MAYEYEIKIPMWLEDGRWLNMNVDDKVLDEFEEVYRKAKAFDEIREIEKTSDITGYHEDTESYMYEVEHVIEKYDMEDE